MPPPAPEVGDDTLAGLLRTKKPRHPAIISPDDGRVVTFGLLQQRVASVAADLHSAGVRRGDRVAIVLPNGPEFLDVILAVMLSGAAAAPLNPDYKVAELRSYLAKIQPDAIVLRSGDKGRARSAVGAETKVVEVAIQRGEGRLLHGKASHRSLAHLQSAEPSDVALLLHTSGTTSAPKLVQLLHRNIAASIRATAKHYELSEEDVSYCAMPLVHVHGLIGSTFAAWQAGGTVIVPRRLAPRAFPDHAREHGVTWLSASPTVHLRMAASNESDHRPPRLRFLRSCSSALSPELMERLEERYEVPVVEAYGMTEASHQIASNSLPPGLRQAGSVGIPTGPRIRIADPAGHDVATGAQGEVLIHGPGVTPGYTDAEANATAFVDGWFRTGDIGALTNGHLELKGRLKDIIVRGGENISPTEVETALLEHPCVTDTACFAIEDATYGEQVAAAVVLTRPTDRRELIDHCRERLADFKLPAELHFVEELPRTSTGKLRRRDLARRFRRV